MGKDTARRLERSPRPHSPPFTTAFLTCSTGRLSPKPVSGFAVTSWHLQLPGAMDLLTQNP